MDRQQSRRLIQVLKKSFDILDIPVIYASLFIAWKIRFESQWFEVTNGIPDYEPYNRTFWAVSLLWFIIFSMAGLYSNRVRFGIEQVFYIVRTIFIAAAALLTGAFFYREFSYSRLTLVLALGSTTVIISMFHLLKRELKLFLQRRGYGLEKVLVIGSGELGFDCYKRIQAEESLLGLKLTGICGDEDPPDSEENKQIPYLGKISNLPELIDRKSVTQVYLALGPEKQNEMVTILKMMDHRLVDIKIVPNVYSIITSSIHISNIAGMPVVNLLPLPIHGIQGHIKAVSDRVYAFLGLIILSPLLALVALKIKMDSPGDAIYEQERVGRDGKSFTIFKFRSMRVDAENETGPVWAVVDDPRRTRFGEFIRKYSIDELPQLWNVLKGEMSLVGPRPERPFFVDQFEKKIPTYADRHIVKTGMTGWAQVNGLRGQSPIEERTRYDIWYIENWSLWLDFVILARTLYVCVCKPTGF
jgi:exopolysaccharide biosynthesis polyprenyl glycosylphosphotransferase